MDRRMGYSYILYYSYVRHHGQSMVADAGGVGGEARTVTERRMEWEGADPDPRYLVW